MVKSSILQQAILRESSPAKSPPWNGLLPVWKFAAQFFVPQNVEPIVEPEATIEPTPMKMDDMLHHSTFEDPINTSEHLNVGESVGDKEAYEPDEPGISDEDGEEEADNDKKNKRWEPPALEAA
jgi:hypothetical protein